VAEMDVSSNSVIVFLFKWLPLIVVILGGCITYYITTIIENNKRHFELKKQIYLEIIDYISTVQMLRQEMQKLLEDESKKSLTELDKESRLKKIDEKTEYMGRVGQALIAKLYLCGASENVISLYSKFSKLDLKTLDFDKIERDIFIQLSGELLDDLFTKKPIKWTPKKTKIILT
jgi:hypothetical protein